MPSIADCITNAQMGGAITPARAAVARRVYNDLLARYQTIMPPHAAQAAAAQDLKIATKKAARSRFHMVVNQLQSARRIRDLIEAADDPAVALRNLLEWSEGSGFAGESVVSLQNAYIRSINGELREVLRKTGRTITGSSRDKALLEDVIRELHAQGTGNATAKALADAVRGQQSRMRRLFNAHGGDIGELSDFGVSHAHDAARIRRAGRDAWKASVRDRLDWSRIVDVTTGKPFASSPTARPNPAEAERFLDEVYSSITTRGWDDRDPSFAVGGKALYNQRGEARVLHFRDADAWLDYNRQFGTTNPFDAMVSGIHAMARDVALMRVLGPNPKLGLEYAIQVAQKRASGAADEKMEAAVRNKAATVRAMLGHISGAGNVPVSLAWANFFGGTRKILTSIQLGSALLSSTTDTVTISVAAQAVGMKGRNVLARSAQLMASHATRETAARMGYVADTLAQTGAASARYLGDTFAPEITERLSDFTLRASGLNYWTDMNRLAFQMEFAGYMAENAGRPLDQVDEPLRRILEARGITLADWDKLRDPAAMFTAPGGQTFLSPNYWRGATSLPADEAEQLATRLQMIVEEQLERAVPSVSVEGRSLVLGSTQPGTFQGELLRSTAMYKNFALSLTLNQYRRFMAQPTPMKRAVYAAKMSAGLLVMGALAVQLKEIAKGRDPRPMTEPKFWLAATFQGGGLGIFGDFFAAEQSRAGGGLAETIAGPVVGLGSDVIGSVASNVSRVAAGDDTLIGRDAANFLRFNTPVASSLWYQRLAFDRLVADQVQDFLDPDARDQWRRAESRARRDFGTQSWWQRGATAPKRGPDLSNALRTP